MISISAFHVKETKLVPVLISKAVTSPAKTAVLTA